jgi:2-polyprenyl-3-methyl-5-hydroxy-6-metoxy-1,4-benzoquinol methylase
MAKAETYAENQRAQYDATSKTRESAERQVAPNYAELEASGPKYANLVLLNYLARRGYQIGDPAPDFSKVNILDFACGVGRMLKAYRKRGMKADGADISESMLTHARADPELNGCGFFLTDGANLGTAPKAHYDIITAFLVMHHISMRQTRIDIMRAMSKALKPDGMVFLEYKIYPGATINRIPENHAQWSENMVAKQTNSKSDVWITPDSLGQAYEDMRLFFNDVAIVEMDSPGADYYTPRPDHPYRFAFNAVFLIGSNKPQMRESLRP